MSWLEPCHGEKRRPRLDKQGPPSEPKGMGSTAGVQGDPNEMALWLIPCSKTLPTNPQEASATSLA